MSRPTVVCCLLFAVCCLLFAVCCLLFVVCCLLFVVYHFMCKKLRKMNTECIAMLDTECIAMLVSIGIFDTGCVNKKEGGGSGSSCHRPPSPTLPAVPSRGTYWNGVGLSNKTS